MHFIFKLRLLFTSSFFLFLTTAFSQGVIVIDPAGPTNDSLSTFHLTNLDHLTKLAGDTVSDHPYYTFLWVFGDGSFINGTRDSTLNHVYSRYPKLNYYTPGVNGAEVTAYATGNYSGGTRPPTKAVPTPSDFFRSPSKSEKTFKLNALGKIDVTPSPSIPKSVIDTTKTGFLRLQLNKQVRPQDTLVSIISFRQPGKVPTQDIGGQVFLFYNSKVKPAKRVANDVKKLFKNTSPPPPPPPSLTHGDFRHQKNLIHFTNIQNEGVETLAGEGISEFKNVSVWTFDSLSADGSDERNLFVEFANDTTMWQLFKNNIGDTLRFLAVMTALGNPDLLGPLPGIQGGVLSDSLANLLQSTYYTDGTFIDITQSSNFQTKIIGVSEVQTPVVSSFDPNNLSLYACQCPDTTRRKVAGVIEFSNDGRAATQVVKVVLKVPDQLNLGNVETISIEPTPTIPAAPQIDMANRTITWTWPALLQPAETAGFGHPSTHGKIVFSILVKEGVDVSQIEPVEACIVFDLNDPMCAPTVSFDQIITTSEDGVITSTLQCEQCEQLKPEESSGFNWWCLMLCLLGLLLLLIIIYLIKKFV